MKVNLKLPRLSMNMEEGTLAQWYKRPGDRFTKGENLYAVETEKAVADVEAPCDGELLECFHEAGATIPVGDVVCSIDRS